MDDKNAFPDERNKFLMDYLLKSDVTEKQFEEIIEKCSKSKTKYVDPDFYPQKKVTIDQPVLKEHQWKRIEDYYPNLFDNITQDSIGQGELGDCYFICALIYIAKDKDLVKTIFHPKSSLEYGCVLVYFKFMGVKLPVIVDTQMPFDLEDSGYDPTIPKFARPRTKEDPCWFVLLEKAYAKLCGSYKAIIEGTISYGVRILMEYFTIYIDDFKSFLPPSSFNQNNNKFDFNKEVFNEIFRLHKKNAMLGCAIIESKLVNVTKKELKDKTGLITNHGYQIIDSREVQKVRLLKLRNPWGKEEWTGPYSDESKEMTEKLKKQLNHVNADDGSFWMSINDFMKYFNDIDYAFPKEKGWKETNLYGIFEGYLNGRTVEYEKPNAGCLPQWSIKFSQKTTVRISYDIGGSKQIMSLFLVQAHGRKLDQIIDDSVNVKYVAANSYFNGIEYNVEDISEPYTFFLSRNNNNEEPIYYRILVESPDQNYEIKRFDDNFMKLNSVSAQSMFPTPDKEFWDPFKNYPLTTCKQWYLRFPKQKQNEKREIRIQLFKNKTSEDDNLFVVLVNTNKKISYFLQGMTVLKKLFYYNSDYEEFTFPLEDPNCDQWTFCIYRKKPMNINHFKFIIWSKEKIDFGLYPEPDPTTNCCYSISGKIKPGENDGASPSDPNNSLLSMKQWCLVFKKSPTTIFIDFTQKEGPKSNHNVYLEIRDKAGDKSEVFYTTTTYFNFPVRNGCTSDRGEFKIEDISKPYALTVSRNKDPATTDWNIIIYGDNDFDMNEIESNHKLGKSVPKYKPKNVDLKPMFFPQIQQIEQPTKLSTNQIKKTNQEVQKKEESQKLTKQATNQNQNINEEENNTINEKKSQSKCCLLI